MIAAAVAGSFSGDQTWYYIGRHWGPKIIARRLSWQEGAQKVYKHLHRHQYWLIPDVPLLLWPAQRHTVCGRFGAHPAAAVFSLNLIGAIVWAITFAYVGYGLGEASQYFIDDFKR